MHKLIAQACVHAMLFTTLGLGRNSVTPMPPDTILKRLISKEVALETLVLEHLPSL